MLRDLLRDVVSRLGRVVVEDTAPLSTGAKETLQTINDLLRYRYP